MKHLLLLNPEEVSEEEVVGYDFREAARAVVLNEEEKIALLFVAKENYYKLPGGGIESHEDQIVALKRECLEEIGTDIDVIGEVGLIVEYRKFERLKQISYCYLAKTKGQPGIPKFMADENQHGFQQVWVTYSEARRLVGQTPATSLEGKFFIFPRDSKFLDEVKSQITG